jgi:predicted RecA/RadA family phage recombinase
VTVQGGIVEYVSPGDHLTMSAAATITGGQMVSLSGNRTVIVATATLAVQVATIGVALFNAVSGDTALTVATDGVFPLTASGAIVSGDSLLPAAAGAVSAAGAAPDARIIVGQALEAISGAATGRCKLQR